MCLVPRLSVIMEDAVMDAVMENVVMEGAVIERERER